MHKTLPVLARILAFLIHSRAVIGHRIGNFDADSSDAASALSISGPGAGSCTALLARGDPCQVFVRFFGRDSFVMQFDKDTSLGDLYEEVAKYVEQRKSYADKDLPQNLSEMFDFFVTKGGLQRKLVGGRNTTLWSLGIKDTDATITVTKGMAGGIAWGTEVSTRGSNNFEWFQHDFITQIYWSDAKLQKHSICTGFIYGDRVLTAAHCFFDKPNDYQKNTQVIAGDGSTHTITGVTLHPKYYGGDGRAYATEPDLALVQVYPGYVPRTSVKLRTKKITSTTWAFLAGFGMTESGGAPSRHRPLVEGAFTFCDGKCSVHTYNRGVPAHFGCAHSGESATASCIGDSGGPWFLRDKHGNHEVFAVNMGATNCRPGGINTRATADFTLLSETRDFWQPFFPNQVIDSGHLAPFSLSAHC